MSLRSLQPRPETRHTQGGAAAGKAALFTPSTRPSADLCTALGAGRAAVFGVASTCVPRPFPVAPSPVVGRREPRRRRFVVSFASSSPSFRRGVQE